MGTLPAPKPDVPSGRPGPDDYALMLGVRGRDRAAFSTLYDRYSPVVFSLCLRGLRDRGDAEDLLLDIFVEIWERADRYDPSRGSPSSYLMGVSRSRLVDRLRSKQARRRVPAEGGSELVERSTDTRDLPAPPNPLDSVLGVERHSRVRSAMQGLSAQQRQAVQLAFFDCMTHSEVARELNEPIGTIKSRIRQALIQLRQVLGGDP